MKIYKWWEEDYSFKNRITERAIDSIKNSSAVKDLKYNKFVITVVHMKRRSDLKMPFDVYVTFYASPNCRKIMIYNLTTIKDIFSFERKVSLNCSSFALYRFLRSKNLKPIKVLYVQLKENKLGRTTCQPS